MGCDKMILSKAIEILNKKQHWSKEDYYYIDSLAVKYKFPAIEKHFTSCRTFYAIRYLRHSKRFKKFKLKYGL